MRVFDLEEFRRNRQSRMKGIRFKIHRIAKKDLWGVSIFWGFQHDSSINYAYMHLIHSVDIMHFSQKYNVALHGYVHQDNWDTQK